MNEHVTVDATGLSCPQPVILTRKALRDHPSGELWVLVDTGTSRDNVRRLAEREGCQVEVKDTAAGGFTLVVSR
ncbi:MAG: sulfurtransferase TusA family protein [Anaerolineae bacterium]